MALALFAWAFSPLAVLVELGAVPATVAAVVLLHRWRPTAALQLVVLLWLVTPGLRRVSDYTTAFHPSSTVLAVAPVCSLVLAALAAPAGRRRPVARDALVLLVAFALAVGYATLVGLALSDPVATATGVLTWTGPAAVGLSLLWLDATLDEALAAVTEVAVVGAVVLGVYGIVQWFVLPPWDAAWMVAVRDEVGSIGRPVPREVRVFSLSNSPGPGAAALAGCVLLAATRRPGPWSVLAVGAGLVTIGLTEVRQVWIALALAVVLLVVRGRRPGRVVALTLLVLLLAAPLAPTVAQTVTDRFTDSTSAGSQDESLNARLQFQRDVLPETLTDGLGRGIGSTGAATRVGTDGAPQSAFANTDSGYLELLRTMGSVAGTAFVVLLLVGVVAVAARRRSDARVSVLDAYLVTLPVQLLFGNALVGPGAVFFWLSIALFGRDSAPPRDLQHPPTHDPGVDAR